MSDELKAAAERVLYRLRCGQSAWLMQPTDPEWKDTAHVLNAYFEEGINRPSRLRQLKRDLIEFIRQRELLDDEEIDIPSQELVCRWIDLYFEDLAYDIEQSQDAGGGSQ